MNALVTELMSIQPECGFVESTQLFDPHILVVTNVRIDHIAQMGSSKQAVARCFASLLPENGTVFIPQEEFSPVFEKAAKEMNTRLIQVESDSFQDCTRLEECRLSYEIEENVRLVFALAEFLKMDRETILQGLKKVEPDFGSLKMWTMDVGVPPQHWNLVSCFAANDPDSTRRVLSRLMKEKSLEEKEKVGLLNLRRDRGDRTIQWLRSLEENVFPEFRRIFLIGDHASAFKKRLKRSKGMELFVLKSRDPGGILEEMSEVTKTEAVLVGMGNMGGAGKGLVEYWDKRGKPYDL